MRLELGTFPVTEVAFGSRTRGFIASAWRKTRCAASSHSSCESPKRITPAATRRGRNFAFSSSQFQTGRAGASKPGSGRA